MGEAKNRAEQGAFESLSPHSHENRVVHSELGSRGLSSPTPVEIQRDFLERLLGLTPEEVLPRIREGDPLGIQTICMRRLRERAYVLDPERAFSTALAEVAMMAAISEPSNVGPDWIQNNVDRALSRLVEGDSEDERRGVTPFDESSFHFVCDAFATPAERSRTATVEFNALPHRTRMAFFLLLIDQMSVDDCLALGHWEPEELRLDIWNAMRALGHVSREEVETFKNRQKRSS